MPETISSYPPLVKAAALGACIIGLWATCMLLSQQGLLRGILQPLVLAFMLVGVVSPFVEWMENLLKLIIGFIVKGGKLSADGLRSSISSGATEHLLTPEEQLEMQATKSKQWLEKVGKTAVKNDPMALQFAPDKVKDNFDIVMAAVEKEPGCIWFASAKLRGNKDIVLTAVSKNGLLLACASDELKADPEVVDKAIAQNGKALHYVRKPDPKEVKAIQKKAQQTPGKLSTCMKSVSDKIDQLEHQCDPFIQAGDKGPAVRAIAVVLTLVLIGWTISHALEWFWSKKLKVMDLEAYTKGLQELQAMAKNTSWGSRIPQNATAIEELVEHHLPTSLAGTAYKMVMQVIMCTIYSLIMLIAPLKEISHVFDTVRSYFARKTASNLIYTIIAFIILTSLNNPMTPVLAIVTFFISYIPEIGAFITCVLPMPFFLLDGNIEMHLRIRRSIIALVAMIVNKFAVGNGFEAVLMGMGSAGTHERKQTGHTHPVLMIAIVLFGGTLWGATGTLFAVPATWLIQAFCQEQVRLWDMELARTEQAKKTGQGSVFSS